MSDGTKSAPARAPHRPLPPVWELAVWSYGSVLRNWRDFFRALCLPAIALAIFVVVGPVVGYAVVAGADPRLVSAWAALIPLLVTPVFAALHLLAATSWHRRIALGRERAKPPLFPRWHKATWRYLGYLLLFTLIVLAIGLVLLFVLFKPVMSSWISPGRPIDLWGFQLVGFVLNLVFYGVIALALSRLLLVLPAVAVQRPLSLGQAMAATGRNGLRIATTLWLIGVPVHLLTLMALPIGVLQQQEMMDAMRSVTLQPGQLPDVSPPFYWIATGLNLLRLPVFYVATFATLSLVTRAYVILTDFRPAGVYADSSPH